MKNQPEMIWGAGVLIAAAAAIISGCSGSKTEQTDASQVAPAPGSDKAAVAVDVSAMPSGSELWAQTCAMCHNSVSPATYSDAQWDVVVSHMRMQARLTGEEERKIRQFLQASN